MQIILQQQLQFQHCQHLPTLQRKLKRWKTDILVEHCAMEFIFSLATPAGMSGLRRCEFVRFHMPWQGRAHTTSFVEQPIGTLYPWVPCHGTDFFFFQIWKLSLAEVQKYSFLSSHFNYNMLKCYSVISVQWCQKMLPILALNYGLSHSNHREPNDELRLNITCSLLMNPSVSTSIHPSIHKFVGIKKNINIL